MHEKLQNDDCIHKPKRKGGNRMKAVILAGGRGSRLMPLTRHTPKPLVPILDKPVMWYIIRRLKQCGIVDIVVTLGYLGEQIVAYFGNKIENYS